MGGAKLLGKGGSLIVEFAYFYLGKKLESIDLCKVFNRHLSGPVLHSVLGPHQRYKRWCSICLPLGSCKVNWRGKWTQVKSAKHWMVYGSGPYMGWFSLRSFWEKAYWRKLKGCRETGTKSVIGMGIEGEETGEGDSPFVFLLCTRVFSLKWECIL